MMSSRWLFWKDYNSFRQRFFLGLGVGGEAVWGTNDRPELHTNEMLCVGVGDSIQSFIFCSEEYEVAAVFS